MQQEQRLILKMLEEGKITAEEAEALMNAIGDSSTRGESGPQEDPWVRLEKMGEDFATKVEDATDRFARSLEHRSEGFSEKINRVFAKFPFIGQEGSQEFTQVVQGVVKRDGDVIPIELENFNGSIRLEGWSEEIYKLTVIQRIRGKDRDLLRGKVINLDWIDGTALDKFKLKIPLLEDSTVSLHLLVPEDLIYEVELSTYNGSLAVDNLEATDLKLETVNGSTRLFDLKAKQIIGKNGNGSCEFTQVEAEKIDHKISNGSYRLNVVTQDLDCTATNGSMQIRTPVLRGDSQYKLSTTNGSIKVAIPVAGDLGVDLDLSTSVGRVSNDLGALEMKKLERMGGGTDFEARSFGYQDKGTKFKLDAKTTSGSIFIGGLDS